MQLASTEMFATPSDAVTFTTSKDVEATMQAVRMFLFERGLLGDGADSPDIVGIGFPDGSILGDEENVKFRFNADYMAMAADGTL